MSNENQTGLSELLSLINAIAPVSVNLQNRLIEYVRYEKYPKKHLLLRDGEVAKRIYFIIEGGARAFHINRAGTEQTSWFMGPGELMISIHSFYTRQPTTEYIELLDKSLLLSITYEQLLLIYKDFPEYNYHGRIFTEKYYVMAEERAILLRIKQPHERYNLLLQTYPWLAQAATLGQIASFLGISQETLSRIRSIKKPKFRN